MMKNKGTRPNGLNRLALAALAVVAALFGGGCSRIHGGYVRGTIPSRDDLEKRIADQSAPLSDSERDHFAGLLVGTGVNLGICVPGESYLQCRAHLQEPRVSARTRNTLLCTIACGENSPLLVVCIGNDVPTAHPEMGTSITCDAAVAATMTDAQLEVTRTRDRVAAATRELETARNLAAAQRLTAEGQRDAERRRAEDAERELATLRAAQAQPTPPPPPTLAYAPEATTRRRHHGRRHHADDTATTPHGAATDAAQTWRTPPTGYVVGFPSAPEIACTAPANGETRCISIGPHGVAQMAALTSATGVTSREVSSTGVRELSPRWHRVSDHSNERVAALLSNNPQPWGPFVVACLATEQPEHGRPVYVSSRWGRRPGNAVTNMTIAEFQTRRASGQCRSGTTTIHVTGQPVRILLDFTVGGTWNHAVDPPTPAPRATSSLTTHRRATRAIALTTPSLRPNAHRTEVMARTGTPTAGSIAWWLDHRWRYWQHSAVA